MEEMTGIHAEEMLGKGDYEYALPFYGERRPILIDLVHLPSEEIEKKYVNIQRQGSVLVGEAYTPQLKGDGPLPVCHGFGVARFERRVRRRHRDHPGHHRAQAGRTGAAAGQGSGRSRPRRPRAPSWR